MFKIRMLFIFLLFLLFVLSPDLDAQINLVKDDFRINDDTTGGTFRDPAVALTKSGYEIVVWEDPRLSESFIFGQAYDNAGNPVGSNFKVSDSISGGWQELDPAIASYHDSLLVVWEYGYGQWLLSNGTPSGPTFEIVPGASGSQVNYSPDVAVCDSGIYISWQSLDKGWDIFFQIFDFNGDSLSSIVRVNEDTLTEHQYDSKVAVDVNGNVMIVWEDNRSGTNSDIYGQLFDISGSPIDTNFIINDDLGTEEKFNPDVATDSSGNFVVVWQDSRDGDANIYGQLFDTLGLKTGVNFLINDDGESYNQSSPSCSKDDEGNFVVVWSDYRNGNADIYAQLFKPSGDTVGFGGNFRIDGDLGTSNQTNPDVSMNDSNFVVGWVDSRNPYSIYKRRFNNDRTPDGNEMKVNDVGGIKDQEKPSVDMNEAGNAVITWYDYRPLEGMYFQRLNASGDTLRRNIFIGDGGDPVVGVSGDGSFVITYRDYNDIHFKRFDINGDSIGTSQIANDTVLPAAFQPSIDISPSGKFVIAWHDFRNGNYDIYAQLFNAQGDTIGENFRVNDDTTTEVQYRANSAFSPLGRFLIAWEDYRNGNYDIFGQIYDSLGNPVDSNFRIDTDTLGTSIQHLPDAAPLSDGNFIVVWGDRRISPNDVVFGQIIDSVGNLLDTNFQISNGTAENPAVSGSPSRGFIVTWNESDVGQDIYAQIYDSTYAPDSTNFKVNNTQEGFVLDQLAPDVVSNDTNIIFTWEDPKWQRGYDIAAKVYAWQIASVDERDYMIFTKLLPNKPNPFINTTHIRFNIKRREKVKLEIFDITGRLINTLLDRTIEPGIHSLIWNGKDEKGKKVSAGIYFCRLTAENKAQSRKMVLLR